MPGRNKQSEEYRYGFNGMERDDEVSGGGNSYTTHYRQNDPRLGRWLSTDPKHHYSQTPYCSMDNNPISFNDILGDDVTYDSFKERKHVFIAKLLDKDFRKKHRERKKDKDTFHYRHVPGETTIFAAGGREGLDDDDSDRGSVGYLVEYSPFSLGIGNGKGGGRPDRDTPAHSTTFCNKWVPILDTNIELENSK